MDDGSIPSAAPLEEPVATSALPDIMNDPEYAPPQRRDTASSVGFGADTCRICRSEGTPDEPLFYPCKCSGSIKFVHQECLMEWLSHSHKKHCELCKTPFRFTKLYDANMPTTLPWTVFVGRAVVHVIMTCVRTFRAVLVSAVWLVAMPWIVRWAWRWMFWFADAGWAREAFMRKIQAQQVTSWAEQHTNPPLSLSQSVYATFDHIWRGQSDRDDVSEPATTLETVTGALFAAFQNATSVDNATMFWPQSDSSILSSWTYLSELTSSHAVNRFILDVFEGQLITCVVITGFILVFLIREWVVQQQPLVHVDNLPNQDVRDMDRLQRERERMRRQEELLQQTRERLLALHEEASVDSAGAADLPEYKGWDDLSLTLDLATRLLRTGDRRQFEVVATGVVDQLKAAEGTGADLAELVEKVYVKLSTYSEDERTAWGDIIVSELRRLARGETKPFNPTYRLDQPNERYRDPSEEDEPAPAVAQFATRPPMPIRGTSSRATQIQRHLEEESQIGEEPSQITAVTEPTTESASVVSAPSTEESWQHIGAEPGQNEQHDVVDHVDIFQENNDEIPITNAGPDAKINIKRRGKGKAIVPEPLEVEPLQRPTVTEGGIPTWASGTGLPETQHAVSDSSSSSTAPDPHDQSTRRERVDGVLKEVMAAGESQQTNDQEPASAEQSSQLVPEDDLAAAENEPDDRPEQAPNYLQRLTDWFWGDIQPPGVPEAVPQPNEELLGEGNNEAPFVLVQQGPLAIADAPHEEPPQENDPDVVAAAQQAGLDAEALEDAEDLEGIFELIGLQGPLVGLFQTSCFCCVLVSATVYGAVGLPYIWGKLVLSFMGAPVSFLVKTPLQLASFIADFLVDLTLVVGGWLMVVTTLLVGGLVSALEARVPSFAHYNVLPWVSEVATSTAGAAGHRLQNLLLIADTAGDDTLGWNWAFLGASAHAHASLKIIQGRSDAVLLYVGDTITAILDTISSGPVSLVWQRSFQALAGVVEIPAKILAGVEALEKYKPMYLDIVGSLKAGALTFDSSRAPIDPSLVYWDTTDRGLAVLTGYLALAAIAAVYVALDRSITRSESGERIEKNIRDTLRQAGGVLKVILIISIEMLIFPLYCGLLLDLAFLPLFRGASAAGRWAMAVKSPYLFCFVHWFVGTCYMFHFALFVGMCRKILRKGVLWFIRDPDDPTFHPVRDVLERKLTTQLRKIAFSALVYGALVILCLGGVIWSIGKVFPGIFPLFWSPIEPVLEFPFDLFVYNLLTPMLFKIIKPSEAVHSMYAWWLRRCARVLRLSHFLFDDRRKDEEGRHVRKTWISFLLMRKGDPLEAIVPSDKRLARSDELPEVYFKRDGKYVLTPCNDQYRVPKDGEAFLHSDEKDVYIADKDGKRNDHFAKVYVPPFFRLRVSLFMVCLWMFSAFAGLCSTLVPLVLGRYLFKVILPAGVRINDLYSYSLGAYILGGLLFASIKGSSLALSAGRATKRVDIRAQLRTAGLYGIRALKCTYVYGLTGMLLTLAVALFLRLYLILPLHTYLVSHIRPIIETAAATTNGTLHPFNATDIESIPNYAADLLLTNSGGDNVPKLAEHTIHFLSDAALAILYLRIALRALGGMPMASEALHRITADGWYNPNAKLATRFVILPATLVSVIVLLGPLLLAKTVIMTVEVLAPQVVVNHVFRTLLYRFAYPLSAGFIVLCLGAVEVANATVRWRSRIRDEVYLVGERLHNFGERKPPVGSRSVVRKEK